MRRRERGDLGAGEGVEEGGSEGEGWEGLRVGINGCGINGLRGINGLYGISGLRGINGL